MKVLLLGGGLQALCCGKALREINCQVDAISDDLQVRKSCFFNVVYRGIDATGQDVYKVMEKDKYDVLIPMADMHVSFLSRNKKNIEERYGCKCACVGVDLLKIVEDKHIFMDFCKNNDIPHPKTSVLTNKTLDNAIKEIGFPALIKPDFSIGARGITHVNTIDELKKEFPFVKEYFGNCTLQEFIDNKEYYYNVILYRDSKGNFLAHTIIKILRMYPVNAGSSSCCISVENDELLQICRDCLNKLNWVGIADFDVLQRLDNREYKIIELNPRVPASLKAALISGVNFPEIIVKDLMQQDITSFTYNTNKIMRYLGLDIMWFLKSNRRFYTNPSWFDFFSKGIFYQDIYKEDCSTWWTWLVEGVKKIGKRNKRLR